MENDKMNINEKDKEYLIWKKERQEVEELLDKYEEITKEYTKIGMYLLENHDKLKTQEENDRYEQINAINVTAYMEFLNKRGLDQAFEQFDMKTVFNELKEKIKNA